MSEYVEWKALHDSTDEFCLTTLAIKRDFVPGPGAWDRSLPPPRSACSKVVAARSPAHHLGDAIDGRISRLNSAVSECSLCVVTHHPRHGRAEASSVQVDGPTARCTSGVSVNCSLCVTKRIMRYVGCRCPSLTSTSIFYRGPVAGLEWSCGVSESFAASSSKMEKLRN